ncbi:MAG: tetratricopeptide repeat protein [Alphaproteobacteria bacterium]|nr:tetratricopeptide repeat protein [Alphaproteobacteria bacterium]
MTDVFDEISDDLRREKLNQFWKENGSWIIGGAVIAVLLTGALSFWRQWEYRRNTAATSELVRLVTASDLPTLESFAKTGSKNHAMLARFMAAGAHLEHNEKDQAIALYNDIAETSGIDKTYRDLARVLSIGQRIDKDDPEKLQRELSALSDDKGVWRYTALELEALLSARQGRMQDAVDVLTKITADPLAPADARTRAFTLRELYMAEKTDPKT